MTPAPHSRILVVDDDAVECRLVRAIFAERPAVEVVAVHDAEAALAALAKAPHDLVILDVHLPGMDGMELLRRIKAMTSGLPVVMLTAHADVKMAVEAIKIGADHFLTKPFEADQLLVTVDRALERRQLLNELAAERGRGQDGALARIWGSSPGIQRVIAQIRQVAPSNFTVLVRGETGTGKELVARAIHDASERRGHPLIAVDCGAIPENLIESELFGHEKGAFSGADRKLDGRFRLADSGTLFLDEIGNLPLSMQAKLLRVLQERTVQPLGAEKALPLDLRFVAATNVDLEAESRSGGFRSDLYYRLAEFVVQLPPLRERRDDILPLALRFREEASVELRRPVGAIADDAVALLLAHPWPGNIRELRNVIRQAVLLTEDFVIRAQDIRAALSSQPPTPEPPPAAKGQGEPGATLKEIADAASAEAEKAAIRRALREHGGNKTQAARALRTDFKTLHLKMKRYGLDAGE